MKALKWFGITVLLAMLTVVAINGSLGDEKADGNKLYIVQSELERTANGLREVSDNRELLPVTDEDLAQDTVNLKDTFTVTDRENNSVTVELSTDAEMYNAKNVLDHIVVVTNTGNYAGYIRTWFAFEMGELTEEEFKTSVLLNQNPSEWTWGAFAYGVVIGDGRYAVVCATYNEQLGAEQTTAPNLLQIILRNGVSGDVVNRLDGNNDGKYEVRAYSQAVSDDGAWSQVSKPWGIQ